MTYGKRAVDWQQRVDFDHLREFRLDRAHKMLHKWGLGAGLCFNWDSGRYLSRPFSHPYARHLPRFFVLLVRDAGYPYYPAGAEAQVENLLYYTPWLKDRAVSEDVLSDPGTIFLRPLSDQTKRWARFAKQVKALMKKHGVDNLPLGVDYASPIVIDSLRAVGLKVVDGNAWILEADMVKCDEEIELMRMAASCQEAGYGLLVKEFKVGMTEDDVRGITARGTYAAGAEYIEGWITESGIRAAPRHGGWSDRVPRPGEFLTLELCHVTYCGYKLCYSRTWLVGSYKPTPLQQELYNTVVEMNHRGRELLKPGMTTHEWAKLRPVPKKTLRTLKDVKDFRASFSNHFGGMGIRWNGAPQASLTEPDLVIEKNMVFAYAPQFNVPGVVGCKIENTFRVTDNGCEVLTPWPYDDIMTLGL